MTAILLLSALFVVSGALIALALPARPRHWHGLLGEAYLLGAGAAGFLLLGLSVAGIRWARASFGASLAVVMLVSLVVAMRRGAVRLERPRLHAANIVDLFTAALMFGHYLLATAADPFETDYLLIWGVKARVFFAAGGIDWRFLESPLNPTTHGAYPVLVPLVYDAYAVFLGAWPEYVGFVTFACGAAALFAMRSLLSDEMPRLARAVVTLILMPLVFSPYIGMAEGPLIAYAIVGVLHVRRGLRQSSRADVLVGALFLGLAASCKNEGLALVAVVAVAMLAARAWRLLPLLWPAVAIPVPWLVLDSIHGVRVDLAKEGIAERLLLRVPDLTPIVNRLLERTGMPLLFWIGVALAIVIAGRRLVLQERFLVIVTVVQILTYALVYLVTPKDVRWHIDTSWDRVLRQVLPLLALVALLPTASVVASVLKGKRTADSQIQQPPLDAEIA